MPSLVTGSPVWYRTTCVGGMTYSFVADASLLWTARRTACLVADDVEGGDVGEELGQLGVGPRVHRRVPHRREDVQQLLLQCLALVEIGPQGPPGGGVGPAAPPVPLREGEDAAPGGGDRGGGRSGASLSGTLRMWRMRGTGRGRLLGSIGGTTRGEELNKGDRKYAFVASPLGL